MTAPPALRLSAGASATDTELRITYEIENSGADAVYVFDVFFKTTPSGQRFPDPQGVYVRFEKERTVRVTRSALAVPSHLKVEFPEFPYLSRLPAGARSRFDVSLRLPVREESPYTPMALEGRLPATQKTLEDVVVSIGFIPSGSDLSLKRIERFGNEVFSIRYGDAMARQHVVEAAPIRCRVPVLVN